MNPGPIHAGLEHIHTIDDLRARLASARALGSRVGLVPTMGALHEGHGALVAAAAADNDVVVTTIFVNPLQFAPTDDLAAYPRDLDGDHRLAPPILCRRRLYKPNSSALPSTVATSARRC